MSVENDLYQAAVDQAIKRYPSGWAGAAAIRTESGKIITSIAPDVKNDALSQRELMPHCWLDAYSDNRNTIGL
jgi:hypothetical protein